MTWLFLDKSSGELIASLLDPNMVDGLHQADMKHAMLTYATGKNVPSLKLQEWSARRGTIGRSWFMAGLKFGKYKSMVEGVTEYVQLKTSPVAGNQLDEFSFRMRRGLRFLERAWTRIFPDTIRRATLLQRRLLGELDDGVTQSTAACAVGLNFSSTLHEDSDMAYTMAGDIMFNSIVMGFSC